MPVSVVIPNWNGMGLLPPLFEDLNQQTRGADEIILVDNGSSDGSEEWAGRQGATVIRLGSNRGFAPAVNRGVDAAASDFVAVLNSDVRLPADWLERMTHGIGEAAFACGRILRSSDHHIIDGTWDAVCRGGTAWRCGAGRVDGPQWWHNRAVHFPPFTALLLRKSDFQAVGGLDEAFESYLEDVEFGLRCASNGYTGRYLPDAVAWHTGSATLGRWHARTVRQISRNQIFLLARHYPPALLREFGLQIAFAQVLWGVVALRHGRGGAWISGKWEGLRAFRRLRRPGSPAVREILSASEREIYSLQAETGWDWYWRMYFALA